MTPRTTESTEPQIAFHPRRGRATRLQYDRNSAPSLLNARRAKFAEGEKPHLPSGDDTSGEAAQWRVYVKSRVYRAHGTTTLYTTRAAPRRPWGGDRRGVPQYAWKIKNSSRQ